MSQSLTPKPKAAFLDRDGVINVDHGYVSSPEQFEFIDGVFDACRHMQQQGYLLIAVSYTHLTLPTTPYV